MTKERIAELREWVYNFHADANLIEGWEEPEWDNQRDLLSILDDYERLRVRVPQLECGYDELKATTSKWKARAEKVEAELEHARPLLEAVERVDIRLVDDGESQYVLGHDMQPLLRAALDLKQKLGKEKGK